MKKLRLNVTGLSSDVQAQTTGITFTNYTVQGWRGMQTWTDFGNVQPLASKIMINSITKNRLTHAYLIQGARGTGKKTFALLLAMTLFCENRNGAEPCQTCHACKRIVTGNHPDVHWIEPDGASIKNEQIDHLRKEFAYTGVESTKKVYIINQSEKLTTHAANRILKFLEEPNIASTAILLTDNGQAILPTIRSRCQIIDLRPLETGVFKEKLVQLEPGISDGNARLLSALTHNLDEAVAYHTEEKIYMLQILVTDFLRTLITDYENRFIFIHQQWLKQIKEKKEQELGLELLLLACRDLVHFQIGEEHDLFFFQANESFLQQAMNHFSQARLLRMLQTILDAKQKLKQNVHPTLVMEQLVLQI